MYRVQTDTHLHSAEEQATQLADNRNSRESMASLGTFYSFLILYCDAGRSIAKFDRLQNDRQL